MTLKISIGRNVTEKALMESLLNLYCSKLINYNTVIFHMGIFAMCKRWHVNKLMTYIWIFDLEKEKNK
jgi:hypothetical protein